MKVLTEVVRYAVGLAQTPIGQQAILAAGGPVAGLLVNFGLVGLQSVLAEWTGAELSDADVRAHLATKGLKVVPFDPKGLFA